MKFAVAVVAVLALAGHLNAYKIPSTGSGQLAKELQNFVDLVPLNKVIEITKVYIAQDKQFKEALQLISGAEFKAYLEDLEKLPEFTELVNYVQKAGVDAHSILKKVNAAFNIKSAEALSAVKITGGIRGYLKDVAAVTPVEKLRNLYDEKRRTSKVFDDFVKEVFLSLKYHKLRTLPETNKHFHNVEAQAKPAGIDSQTLRTFYPVLMIVKVASAKVGA